MRALHAKAESFEAARRPHLWIYGRIVEASEPYEILANLIAISQGDTYGSNRFPPQNDSSQSPGIKVKALEEASKVADLPDAVTPLKQIWNQDLRSAFPPRPFRIRLRESELMEGIDYARNHLSRHLRGQDETGHSSPDINAVYSHHQLATIRGRRLLPGISQLERI